MFLQGIKLLLGLEYFNQFKNPSLKDVELPEDLGLTEVKVVAFREIFHLLLYQLILFLVASIQFDAGLQNLYQFLWLSIPDIWLSYSWLV